MRQGGIILCGGKSTRMGMAKATLPFGDEQMLQRVVRLLLEVVDCVVVVAAEGQQTPQLPSATTVVYDRREGRGPLEGIATGLAALPEDIEAAYVTGCDVPLLRGDFVRLLFDLLGEHEIVVPREGKFHHPLSAVYRRRVLSTVERLLAEDRMRPFFLFDEVATREVLPEEWTKVDPDSKTLANLNHPQDYLRALELCGLEVSPEIREKLS